LQINIRRTEAPVRISTASALHFVSRSLPLAVLIRTLISVRRTLIRNLI